MKLLFRLLPVFATLFATAAQAQVILLDSSPTTGQTTTAAANAGPYPTSSGSTWNGGLSAWSTALTYSDGTPIPGTVRVYTDALDNVTGGARYSFGATASSAVAGSATNGSTGVFGTLAGGSNPYKDAAFGGVASNAGYGGVGMRVTGLAFGTYQVYVSAGYIGTTNNGTRPGEANPATFNIWAFSGAGTGFADTTLTTGTFGTPGEVLENSTTASWSQGNNFALLTVTLDASNPALYLISENANPASPETRGWLNAVQIVAVPESSSLGLLAGMVGALAFYRRRGM